MRLAPLLLGLFTAGPAQAFSLPDHSAITRAAIEHFNRCQADAIDPLLAAGLEAAVIKEDIDFSLKWTLFSHFYHPYKSLKVQWRYNSSIRVSMLQEEYVQRSSLNFPLAFESLGEMIHHIQDMASPPHVVPVMHGLQDSFENYDVSFPPLDYDCRAITAGTNPIGLLKDSAITTLNALEERLIARDENGMPIATRWTGFWREAEGPKFGDYGYFGDRFGETEISVSERHFAFRPGDFVRFKQARLRDAALATERALYWAYRIAP